MLKDYGFVRVSSATPVLKVANPLYNVGEIEKLIRLADEKGAAVLVFPELCVTGYSCGDLFGQTKLLQKAWEALESLCEKTKDTKVLYFVGMPLVIEQRLYNCAVAIQSGKILGIVPKKHIANYKEYYEKRWFTSGVTIAQTQNTVLVQGMEIPFGNLIFTVPEYDLNIGVEICEDLWAVIPPSSHLAMAGANLIVNLSASNDLVSKTDYRHSLIRQQSARCISAYAYASAGVHESSTDVVFGGDNLIAENGTVLSLGERFQWDNNLIFADVDIQRLNQERLGNITFAESTFVEINSQFTTIILNTLNDHSIVNEPLLREIPKHPFIPGDPQKVHARCQEIFSIQVAGLAKRLLHTGIKTVVLGVSGGLDSTLALLVCIQAMETAGLASSNILAVTMPGFGTSDMTYSNAMELMKSNGVTVREIDITKACIQHLADIDQDINKHDVVFENVQARERTQILMDLANKHNGLVVGTGDLSEIALGWSTFNGDQMSMYNVNCGVPKTLVKFLVQWVADNIADLKTKSTLYKIIETPISPELIPSSSGKEIEQKTEDIVGPYELHDFFLYYTIRCAMPPKKVLLLATKAFAGIYSKAVINKWLKVFYSRFFSQQFKRSAMPDGPKVGTISLSPRGDWRMPSDADAEAWLSDLE